MFKLKGISWVIESDFLLLCDISEYAFFCKFIPRLSVRSTYFLGDLLWVFLPPAFQSLIQGSYYHRETGLNNILSAVVSMTVKIGMAPKYKIFLITSPLLSRKRVKTVNKLYVFWQVCCPLGKEEEGASWKIIVQWSSCQILFHKIWAELLRTMSWYSFSISGSSLPIALHFSSFLQWWVINILSAVSPRSVSHETHASPPLLHPPVREELQNCGSYQTGN